VALGELRQRAVVRRQLPGRHRDTGPRRSIARTPRGVGVRGVDEVGVHLHGAPQHALALLAVGRLASDPSPTGPSHRSRAFHCQVAADGEGARRSGAQRCSRVAHVHGLQ
jgi:hypothetical protein